MSGDSSIKLYFLTGFLGSGKTTLLNNLLDQLAEREEKAGVIVNEWGQVGIDGTIIHSHGMEIKELNNGQIFCSCLAGSFVQALAAFAELPLKYLLVETSGLANPVSLHKVLADLKAITDIRYDYQGMIALIDPENFLELVDTVNAVEEQVISSQYLIINKIDLVSEETLEKVVAKIKELNSAAPICQTSFAKINHEILEQNLMTHTRNTDVVRNVKTPYRRARHYLLTTKSQIDPQKVANFTKIILKDAFRIKGFINSKEGWFYLDAVNDIVEVKPVKVRGNQTKIVIISRIWEEIEPIIKETWRTEVGSAFEVKEDTFK